MFLLKVLIGTKTIRFFMYYHLKSLNTVSTSLLTATAAVGLIAVAIPALIASLS